MALARDLTTGRILHDDDDDDREGNVTITIVPQNVISDTHTGGVNMGAGKFTVIFLALPENRIRDL